MPKTLCEDFADWFGSLEFFKPLLVFGVALLSCGAYLISSRSPKSTFFCLTQDNAASVIALQWLGLSFDAVIIILFWRVLAWTRTTRSRLRTISGILVNSSVVISFLPLALYVFRGTASGPYHSRAPDSLYFFDLLADGSIFSVFAISSGLAVCEDGPSNLAGVFVLLSALLAALRRILLVGTWENIWRFETNLALFLVCVGFITFVYTSGVRSVLLIHRVLLVILFLALIITAPVFSLFKESVMNGHPLEKLIYDSRVEADRWLVHAAVSGSLKVAVAEYQERNHGRDPPPMFDIWHEFATERDSPIIDYFPQIANDLLPFWAFTPQEVRRGTAMVASQPGIALVKVQGHLASHKELQDSPHRPVLDDLVEMINTFAKHLPDMELAINLNDQPRVLASWLDTHRFGEAGKGNTLKNLISRLDKSDDKAPQAPSRADISAVDHSSPISVSAFRQMTALACDPGTRSRSGVHWNIRSFCSYCVKPQSWGQFLLNWDAALDVCHQPDLSRLHAFHASPPKPPPIEHLLPVFGRSKTSSYSDILIPLRRTDETSQDGLDSDFVMKGDKLVWRGDIDVTSLDHERFHGGHQERLLHLINNSSSTDRVTLLLPTANNKDRFIYESVPAPELNEVLPFDVGVQKYGSCDESQVPCEVAHREFGVKPKEQKLLESRYVLVTDTDRGSPIDVLSALRSTSVPFVSSVFREWYTERLLPWVHFVPIDLRYHALHSTLAYFAGLKGRGAVNGREHDQGGKIQDAKWIADQGRRWAGKALRREDMEVYLFRLLLEWGRLIDDDRDTIGFRLE